MGFSSVGSRFSRVWGNLVSSVVDLEFPARIAFGAAATLVIGMIALYYLMDWGGSGEGIAGRSFR
jgi:hypothetical protein